jgi:hypothetical protein
MSEPDDDLPQEFLDLVDQFIDLANRLGQRWPTARISSAIMYAAARYNAFNFYALDPAPEVNQERAFEYLCEQYRAMLQENMAGGLSRLFRQSEGGTPESHVDRES